MKSGEVENEDAVMFEKNPEARFQISLALGEGPKEAESLTRAEIEMPELGLLGKLELRSFTERFDSDELVAFGPSRYTSLVRVRALTPKDEEMYEGIEAEKAFTVRFPIALSWFQFVTFSPASTVRIRPFVALLKRGFCTN